MFTVFDINTNSFAYYEDEHPFLGVCDKIYTETPKVNYKDWVKEIYRNAREYSLEFIGFTHETFIHNNVVEDKKIAYVKQPSVKSCRQVLKSLNLTKDLTYLVINAGGNRVYTMPFYKALENKINYTEHDILKIKRSNNIITLDPLTVSRAKYKINYLDYYAPKCSVILGACKISEYEAILAKAFREARNYIVLYSNIKGIKCVKTYQGTDDYNFYVYDMQNLDKSMQYAKLKSTELDEEDKYKITELEEK